MKKLLIGLCTSLLLSTARAQETIEPDTNHCQYYSTIQGPVDVQAASEKIYIATIEGEGGTIIPSQERSNDSIFRITRDGGEEASFPSVSSFSYSFGEPGIYSIVHQVAYNDCDITTTATIVAYEHSISYIGAPRADLDDTIINNMKQRNILLRNNTLTQQNITTTTNDLHIGDSELIIIDGAEHLSLQQTLTHIESSIQNNSRIIIISDASTNLSKKIFGSMTRDIDQPVHVINNETTQELILLRRTGERDRSTSLINQSAQINNQDQTQFGFNAFVDALLYQGIPLPIIASMIMLGIMTLILIFLRQVVGIQVFSIYYPLLGAITLLLIGNKLFLILLAIARFAHQCTYLLSRKLSILVHAKIGVYITLYIIYTVTALRAISILMPQIDRSYIQNIGTRSMVTGFFSVLIIGQKIFTHSKKRIRQIEDVIIYGLLITPITYFLTDTNTQYRVITHTWIVFFIIILVIGLGRFTGMKLLEYKRFGKLLWKGARRKRR